MQEFLVDLDKFLTELHSTLERAWAWGIVNWSEVLAWYVCAFIVFSFLSVYEEEIFVGDRRERKKALRERDAVIYSRSVESDETYSSDDSAESVR